MRQVVLDTETTGLDPRQGHRIIEVAALEMVNRRMTGRTLHKYINPGREIDEGAAKVHGITLEFLADKPRFGDIAEGLLDFISGAELVIHNAPFDVGFLNAEFGLLGRVPVETVCNGVCDTLVMARRLHPGKRNSLDALCERYTINNSHRVLHGALLDTELLAEVYLAMTRGQDSLIVEEVSTPEQGEVMMSSQPLAHRSALRVIRASDEERAAHDAVLAGINKESKGACIWLKGQS